MLKKPSNPDSCLFCSDSFKEREKIMDLNTAFAVFDKYPITEGHMLIIPYRHVPDYFALSRRELLDINTIIHILASNKKCCDGKVDGWNIGINCGEVAGQTILHCHVHLIPRRIGDIENPVGGVRNIFPGKGDYLND